MLLYLNQVQHSFAKLLFPNVTIKYEDVLKGDRIRSRKGSVRRRQASNTIVGLGGKMPYYIYAENFHNLEEVHNTGGGRALVATRGMLLSNDD